MKRLSYLAPIAALVAVLVVVIARTSPYSPVVQPCCDIEEIWAIEDARQESDVPLVTMLFNYDQPLAYDYSENTFYCSVSLDEGDAWPQFHLTAPDLPEMRLCFVDDYTFDSCTDALRDGYAYQIIAYNDAYFSYAQIVFTGLPVVTIHADQDLLAHEDVPVSFAMSAADRMSIETTARAHKRGDTSLRKTPKNGVKVEFTRNANGTKKTYVEMPLLGRTDEFILLSGSMDKQLIRDYLCWRLYNGIVREEDPFGSRDIHYVELFVNDRYQGVYLILKPYDYAEEMAKAGVNAPDRDALYRLAGRSVHELDRPLIQDHRGIYYEQHYGSREVEPLVPIMEYLDLFAEEDDELFCQKAQKYLDIDSVIRYGLLVQACGMTDNEHNNLYIWAHMTESGPIYRFSPWDMDVSFGRDDEENSEVWYGFELFDRLIELDCGQARSRLLSIWTEMRRTAFSDEYITYLIEEYMRQMDMTGAYYRDALRWGKENAFADAYNIHAYAISRMQMMDRRIGEITSEELAGRKLRIQGYTTFDEGAL